MTGINVGLTMKITPYIGIILCDVKVGDTIISIHHLHSMASTQTTLESETLTALSKLDSLVSAAGKVFAALASYSSDNSTADGSFTKLKEALVEYQALEAGLKEIVRSIENKRSEEEKDTNEKSNGLSSNQIIQMDTVSEEVAKLTEQRDSLQETAQLYTLQLTNILEQSYKLQFHLQTLLACSEEPVAVPEDNA
ncbi:4674_t:CDS:2 [Paraglomus brasilianum]|uniref:4674_t:CDS:1 n=1 Tax=Paraglomus brasilianum TaxID=144538 RepID=A0A9N9FWV0_9GLOM|nr:4674_t:CDS:2 [Paraglomus brasilianum]